MAIPRTSLLDLPLPVTGSLSGDWGAATNNGLTEYLDIAVAGSLVLNTDADVTLTSTDGDENGTNIGSTTAQYAILRWTATGSTTRNITVPAKSKTYIVINATGGTQSIVLRGAGPTTGVTIVSGEKAVCAWNGSDFVKVGGAAGGTNTQVQFNDNGVFGGSANLTWDGSTLATTGLTASGAVTLSATTQNIALGTSQVGGTWTAGGASQTGAITLDQSTKTHTLNIGTGATENALTKTINLGTAGVSGSTTAINIGSAVSGATSSISVNGALSATGNVTLSGGTANGVLYLNGSKVATSGSALTFDGTNLGIGTSSPGYKLDVAGGNVNIANGYGYLWGGGAVQAYSNGSYLRFRTASTDRLEIDSSGNLGLGVAPSAWSTLVPALQIGGGGSFIAAQGASVDALYVGTNAHFDGTNWKYKISQQASYYLQNDGTHAWYNAPSGTAGNAITFTQALTLTANRNFLVGTTSENSGNGGLKVAGQFALTTSQAFTASGSVNDTAYHIVCYSLSGTCTLTLPTPANNTGRLLNIVVQSAQQVVSASSNVTKITDGTPTTDILPATAGKWVQLWCDGGYWIIIATNV